MKLFLSSVCVLFLLNFSYGKEKITHFHADLRIDSAGLLTVHEKIDVQIEGKLFKRGIVRSLLLTRTSNNNQRYQVDYNLQEVLVNGEPATYHIERKRQELFIYIGSQHVLLSPGLYSYELIYTTDNQIGYFTDFDELYWNVNGLGWNVSMDKVSASVYLPDGATLLETSCYTGKYSSQASNCMVNQVNDYHVNFQFNDAKKREGLTIVTTFEKGVLEKSNAIKNVPRTIEPPSFFERHFVAIITGLFFVILLIYYILTWLSFGIDPPKPTVYPQFEPPQNMSPASMGALELERYSARFVSASIVHLAIQGYLKIEESTTKGLSKMLQAFKSKKYVLHKLKEPTNDLPKEEILLMNLLFKQGRTSIAIDGQYNSDLASTMAKYQKSILSQWKHIIFKGFHAQFWIFPILFAALYFFIVLSIGLPSMPYVKANTYYVIGFAVVGFIMFLVYQWLIRKPSKEKLQIKAAIDGFEMYLRAAEEKQLQAFNPPELTPELFEKYLPYAIVLGAEKIWGKKFQNLVEQMTTEQRSTIQPTWYAGNNMMNFSSFSNTFSSSFSQSVSSTTTSPSSGSSGGGFSGGGGGGGGGGGW